MWCCTLYDLGLRNTRGRIHPEISNNLDHMQIRCWVSKPQLKALIKTAMFEAGLTVAKESDQHLVYKNLPIETTDEELIAELKVLVRALLPIVRH